MMNSMLDILNSRQNQSALVRGVTAAMIVTAANEILLKRFGKEILEHASAAYVRNETLCIACLSSVAAQEIKLIEQNFLDELNREIPRANLKKIRYLS